MTTEERIERLEEMLQGTIEDALADGWQLIDHAWGSLEYKTCCALTSVFIADKSTWFISDACQWNDLSIEVRDHLTKRRKFPIGDMEITVFARGFDGKPIQDPYLLDDVSAKSLQAFYELGKRLREKYLTKGESHE